MPKVRRSLLHRSAGDDSGPSSSGAAADVPITVRVLAVVDWTGDKSIIAAIPFSSGDAGDLMYVSPQGWVCVRVHDRTGWVPADHWRIVTDVRLSHLSFSVR